MDIVGSLPLEVAEQIFGHLPARTLASCCQVSRRWRSIAVSERLWRPLLVRDYPHEELVRIANEPPRLLAPESDAKRLYNRGALSEVLMRRGQFTARLLEETKRGVLMGNGSILVTETMDGKLQVQDVGQGPESLVSLMKLNRTAHPHVWRHNREYLVIDCIGYFVCYKWTENRFQVVSYLYPVSVEYNDEIVGYAMERTTDLEEICQEDLRLFCHGLIEDRVVFQAGKIVYSRSVNKDNKSWKRSGVEGVYVTDYGIYVESESQLESVDKDGNTKFTLRLEFEVRRLLENSSTIVCNLVGDKTLALDKKGNILRAWSSQSVQALHPLLPLMILNRRGKLVASGLDLKRVWERPMGRVRLVSPSLLLVFPHYFGGGEIVDFQTGRTVSEIPRPSGARTYVSDKVVVLILERSKSARLLYYGR